MDSEIINHLVLAAGFSRHNAEVVLELEQLGWLTETEKEVISKIRLNPRNDEIPSNGQYAYILNHLNYIITTAGGKAVNTKIRNRL